MNQTATAARQVRRAICCHCSTRCGVLVDVDQHGLPTSIQGDPNHPSSQGFLCPRGRSAIEYFRHPDRLNHPLKRVGGRGEGRWARIGWDQALDEIAERLLRMREESGPESLAYLCGTFHGADANFGYRLMHHFGSPNSGGIGLICGGPRFLAESLTFGCGPTYAEIGPGITRVVLLWGQRPSSSAPTFWRAIRQAQRAGATLVAVDPYPTLESRQSDLWLQPRPGTDAALALGLINVILEEALWDQGFVARWATGLEALRGRAKEYGPRRVAEITGVPEATVRQVARVYATAPTAAMASGSPNGRGRDALAFEQAAAALIALTGNLDRPGGNRLAGPVPGLGSKTSYEDYAALPIEQRHKRLGADRFRLHDEGFERLSAAARRVWFDLPQPFSVQFWAAAHPPTIFRAIATGAPYQVRALLVQHNNVLGTYPNARLICDALTSPRLELSVVHELFLTPTAMLADYVLPAASWIEKPFLWSSGRGDTVISGEQVTAPLAERRSDFDVCRDLGRRLGQTWPDTVEDVWDEWLREAGVSFKELVARPDWWLPNPNGRDRHQTPDPATGEPLGFGTPSGRIELAPSILEQLGYDPLPAPAAVSPREPPPSGTLPAEESAGQSSYPLYLMTGATRIDATQQDHRQIPQLRARHPDPELEIDPRLAERHGIAEGDWVRIETPLGAAQQRARFVPGLGLDRVSAERWWYPDRDLRAPRLAGFWGSNIMACVDDDPDACDPAYGAWPYRVARCRIARGEAP